MYNLVQIRQNGNCCSGSAMFLYLHDTDTASVLDQCDLHVHCSPIPGKWQTQPAV